MTKAILFDYGGTLDTAATHWAFVLHNGFLHAGCDFSFEAFRSSYVHGERTLAKFPLIHPTDNFHTLLLKKTRIETEELRKQGIVPFCTPEECEALSQDVAKYCDDFARAHVQASAVVLHELHKRYKLVMVSNFYGNLPTILKEYGIAECFSAVIESAVVGVRKPDVAIYQLGVEAAGCKADECVVVGDSYTKDIVPAHSIGCQTVWFKGKEWENKEYDETIPTHIIITLNELLSLY